MICWTSRVSRSLSSASAGEPVHGLGVVGGLVDRLGQQPDRADRGLQLVADVGDEVAADRLDPALAGAVLDQRQHQPRAQRRDPGGDVRGDGAAAPASSSSASRIWPSRRTSWTSRAGPRRGPALPRTSPRAYAGAEALSTRSSSSTTTALLRSTESTAATPGGTSGSSTCGQPVLLAVADVPGEHGAAGDDRPDDARRATAWVVGSTRRSYARDAPTIRRWTPSASLAQTFTARSPSGRRPVTSGLPRLRPMREAFHDQLDAIFADLAAICGQVRGGRTPRHRGAAHRRRRRSPSR